MPLRAEQMSTVAWLSIATVLTAGAVATTMRRSHPADGVTWRVIPSDETVQRTARPVDRAAIAPRPPKRRPSNVANRVEQRKAAAVLLLMMLGGKDRFASVSR